LANHLAIVSDHDMEVCGMRPVDLDVISDFCPLPFLIHVIDSSSSGEKLSDGILHWSRNIAEVSIFPGPDQSAICPNLQLQILAAFQVDLRHINRATLDSDCLYVVNSPAARIRADCISNGRGALLQADVVGMEIESATRNNDQS
jgi:hypothetical protein